MAAPKRKKKMSRPASIELIEGHVNDLHLLCWRMYVPVLRIRIGLDPFQFGQPDPDLFHETDPGSKKLAKIMENVHKKQPKS